MPEWRRRLKLIGRMRNVHALLCAVVCNRRCKTPVANDVQRVSRHRKQATGKLVDSLRAAFEAGEALLDAELDGLVVARFKMESGHEFVGSPVPSPERLAIVESECRAD